MVGSHVTTCNRECQNTCKLERDGNYCFSPCACCQVEADHFICSTIITSCWHWDCWHQPNTPVGLLSPKGKTTSCQQWARFDLASGWALNYESGRRFTQKEFERSPTASLNSLLPVSMNSSFLLNKTHQERYEMENTSTWEDYLGMPSYDIVKSSSCAGENVFTVDCLFLLIRVINSEILEVSHSRSTPHGYVNSNP